MSAQDITQSGSHDERLVQAVSLHRAGNTQAAERLYRDILLEHPNQPNANYNLGVIALEEKHADDSLLFFKAALEADPQEEQYWLSYIRALIQAEHFDDAQLVLSYGVKAGLAGKEVESLALTLEIKLKQTSQKQNNLPPSAVEDELIALFEQQRYEEIENKILALVQQYPSWLVGW
ncbi:MAG: tetratricopeptide repeat protein, partial [Methylophilaceae bacterium]